MKFPNWPVQRMQAGEPRLRRSAVVLYHNVRQKGQRVKSCCDRARHAGIEPGLTVAETKALLEVPARRQPATIVEDDPAANLAGLRKLAVWCQRYSPAVGVDDMPEPDSLLIDVTGCTHLFGGEEQLANRLLDDLRGWRYQVQSALADTVGAAWGVAHFAARGRPPRVIPPGEHANVLPALPIEALRLSAATVATLHDLDVRSIRQLQAIPRSTLPSRLGPDLLRRLDQAFGGFPESVTPIAADEPLGVRRDLDPPIADRRGLSIIVGQLLKFLLAKLAPRNEGALRVEVRFVGEQAGDVEFTVATKQPTDSAERWRELFDLQLERMALADPTRRVQLSVTATAPLDSRQGGLFESETGLADRKEFNQLLERLGNRLGNDRVVRPRLLSEEQPEHAVTWDPVLEPERAAPRQSRAGSFGESARNDPATGRHAPALFGDAATIGDAATLCDDDGLFCDDGERTGTRPLRLEPVPVPVEVSSLIPDGPPIRLHWRAMSTLLPRCWGPERIETGWWRDRHVRRDYFRVETEDGRHLWLFRTEAGDWFLQGAFE